MHFNQVVRSTGTPLRSPLGLPLLRPRKRSPELITFAAARLLRAEKSRAWLCPTAHCFTMLAWLPPGLALIRSKVKRIRHKRPLPPSATSSLNKLRNRLGKKMRPELCLGEGRTSEALGGRFLPMCHKQAESLLRRTLQGFSASDHCVAPRFWQPDFGWDHAGAPLACSKALTTCSGLFDGIKR